MLLEGRRQRRERRPVDAHLDALVLDAEGNIRGQVSFFEEIVLLFEDVAHALILVAAFFGPTIEDKGIQLEIAAQLHRHLPGHVVGFFTYVAVHADHPRAKLRRDGNVAIGIGQLAEFRHLEFAARGDDVGRTRLAGIGLQ